MLADTGAVGGMASSAPGASAHAGPSRLPFASPPTAAAPTPPRPRFSPDSAPSPCSLLSSEWRAAISAPTHFSLAVFLSTLKDLALHPERNSSLILRADPLPSRQSEPDDLPFPAGLDKVDEVRARLMPKQPKRDGRLDQLTLFYCSPEPVTDHAEKERAQHGVVIMVPEVKELEDVPFYHPPVRALAFTYEPVDDCTTEFALPGENSAEGDESAGPPVRAVIGISYLAFPDSIAPSSPKTTSPSLPRPLSSPVSSARPTSNPPTSLLGVRATKARKRSPLATTPLGNGSAEPSLNNIPPPAVILDPTVDEGDEAGQQDGRSAHDVVQDRLYRTCFALLERVYRHGYGSMLGYKKRVEHDVVVARESFQDLYLVLKDRHRHLDSRAPKPGSTRIEDVKRHVWKKPNSPTDSDLPTDLSEWGAQDVAVAAFLMLLWKDMYPARTPASTDDGEVRDWDTWGRPAEGFVDLGCGNGLLVHILTSEGYKGKGYELRARRTWPAYPSSTKAALIELPIDPPSWFPNSIDEWESGSWDGRDACVVKAGTFLIGNHADELTPWLPLLSLIPSSPVPHLSLPCCLHTLDSAFTQLSFNPPPHPHSPPGGFDDGFEHGASRYKAYLMWLGWCGLQCGWLWEKEGLRVPSTKGWGIVARTRWTQTEEDLRVCRKWALNEVNAVRERGAFKIREKEGKDH